MILTPQQKYFRNTSYSEVYMDSPRGPVSIFSLFHKKKCRHDINKFKFNRNNKCSNLSSQEWSLLKSLKKRKNIVFKVPDKGSVVVVWRVDLYQKEAYGNFLAPLFMQKLKKISLSSTKKLSKIRLTIL